MQFNVHAIDTLHVNDNYAWAIVPSGSASAFIVDPGEAPAVLQWLTEHQLQLGGILITHRHWDHVGGLPGLLAERPGTPVWGPAIPNLPETAVQLDEGDDITVGDVHFQVLAAPGHTRDHIAYYTDDNPQPALFCGDTLFASGCGRNFEGTAKDLYGTLNRFSQLPVNTQIFCAHEYTLANLAFAQAVEPRNTEIVGRRIAVAAARDNGQPSLPSRLDIELATNPFLRCQEPDVVNSARRRAGHDLESPEAVFAELRRWKDSF